MRKDVPGTAGENTVRAMSKGGASCAEVNSPRSHVSLKAYATPCDTYPGGGAPPPQHPGSRYT